MLQKLLSAFADWTIFLPGSVEYSASNILSHIACPAFGGVKRDHPNGMRILAAQDVLDGGAFVGFIFASLAIGATQARTKIVEHNINGDIKAWLARYQRGLVTIKATTALFLSALFLPMVRLQKAFLNLA